MNAPVVASCWICETEPPEVRCGGWGCWTPDAPRMVSADLKALTRPRLCVVCETRIALVGDGKNECEKCDPARNDKYKRDPTDREQAQHEMTEQHFFEREHRWGAGVRRTHAGARLTDYDRSGDDD